LYNKDRISTFRADFNQHCCRSGGIRIFCRIFGDKSGFDNPIFSCQVINQVCHCFSALTLILIGGGRVWPDKPFFYGHHCYELPEYLSACWIIGLLQYAQEVLTKFIFKFQNKMGHNCWDIKYHVRMDIYWIQGLLNVLKELLHVQEVVTHFIY